MKNAKKEMLILGISSIFILVFVLLDLNRLTGIQHIYDESGYWSAAAYLTGLDWKDLTSYNLYYSYGYSFILALIIKFFSGVNLYQVAIVVNAVFLLAEFHLIYYALKKIFSNINIYVVFGISFILAIYPYNLFYAHLTICEIILSFLFWLIIALYIKLLEKKSLLLWLVLAVITSFSYIVHQRNIGIVLVVILMTCIFAFTQRHQWKYFICFIVVLSGILILSNYIKQSYVSSWFNATSSLATNDYSGQVGKLSLIFSLEGIPYLLFSIMGKWFGICASTFFLVSFGLIDMLKDTCYGLRKWVKEGKVERKVFVEAFLVLCFLAAFAINVVFLIYPQNYADYLIYTRYTDTAALPLVAWGLYRFYKKDIKLQEVLLNIVFLICSLGVVLVGIQYNNLYDYVGQANVAVWDLYTTGMNVNDFMCMAAVRAIVVCAIVYIFACVKDCWRYCLLLIGLLWLYSGISAYQKDNASRETNDIEIIADTIESMETIDNIYYYVGNSENVSLNVFNIQLRNPSSVIHIIKSWNEIELLDQGCYIITNKLEELKTTYFSDVKILERNKSFALLQKQ